MYGIFPSFLLDFFGKCRQKYHHTWSLYSLGHKPFASHHFVFQGFIPILVDESPKDLPLAFPLCTGGVWESNTHWKINSLSAKMKVDGK